jgi:hypothetical protein
VDTAGLDGADRKSLRHQGFLALVLVMGGANVSIGRQNRQRHGWRLEHVSQITCNESR